MGKLLTTTRQTQTRQRQLLTLEESQTTQQQKRILFSFDGASEVRSRVRRGVLSLRVVLQMWT